jgi:hypothetical protein
MLSHERNPAALRTAKTTTFTQIQMSSQENPAKSPPIYAPDNSQPTVLEDPIKIIARNIYRELKNHRISGLQIISISSELLTCLLEEMDKKDR